MKEKKGLSYLVAICVASAAITACGGTQVEEKNVASPSVAETGTDTVADEINSLEVVKPDRLGDIRLAEYRNLVVTVPKMGTVSDEQVEEQVKKNLSSMKVPVDVIQNGDIATIDFTGRINGEEIKDGSATYYKIEVGSGDFIDGFEDALVGMQVGETKEIPLRFPDDYDNADLAGQDVVFTVVVNQAERVPDLTDEIAKEVNPECNSADEYRKKVRKQLEGEEDSTYELQKKYAALDDLKALSEISVSDEAIEWAKNLMIKEYYVPVYAEYSHTDNGFADMLVKNNMPLEDFKDNMNAAAKQLVEDTLVGDAILKEAGIEVTDEDREEYAKSLGTTKDELLGVFGKDYFEQNVRTYAALKQLSDNVVFTYTEE